MISEPPVLAHFDVDATTVISCDASGTAVGACLSQVKGGVKRRHFTKRIYRLRKRRRK